MPRSAPPVSRRRLNRRPLVGAGLSLLLSGALASCNRPAAAPDWVVSTNPALTQLIDSLNRPYSAPRMPGAIIAVVQGDEPVFLKGYGLASREFDVPWDPTIIYTFFSTTKSMTSAAILTAADRGLLSLDDDIRKYLLDFPAFPDRITIRQLLNHTSGLWEDEELVTYLGAGASTFPITNDEMYELAKRQPALSFKPGTSNYYNDAGMRYAARILEKVTGKRFAEAMKELVFDPAGMSTARIKPYEPMWFHRQAPSYDLDRTQQLYPDIGAVIVGGVMTETSGDGAGSGSMLDYLHYARYLRQKTPSGRSMIERLVDPVEYHPGVAAPYRFGMRVIRYRGITVYEHGGLYGKEIAYLPEFDTWILTMRNALDFARVGMTGYLYQVVDAFCRTDTRCSHYLSPDNPLAQQTRETPVDQRFTDAEFALLQGSFVEPESGLPIQLLREEHRIRYRLLSTTADLVRGADGPDSYRSFENVSQDLIRVWVKRSAGGPGIALQFADWSEPRLLIPAASVAAPSPGAQNELAGLYRSPGLWRCLRRASPQSQSTGPSDRRRRPDRRSTAADPGGG